MRRKADSATHVLEAMASEVAEVGLWDIASVWARLRIPTVAFSESTVSRDVSGYIRAVYEFQR